jgi:hypothetical protein
MRYAISEWLIDAVFSLALTLPVNKPARRRPRYAQINSKPWWNSIFPGLWRHPVTSSWNRFETSAEKVKKSSPTCQINGRFEILDFHNKATKDTKNRKTIETCLFWFRKDIWVVIHCMENYSALPYGLVWQRRQKAESYASELKIGWIKLRAL